jgi:hypothetical protein
MKRILILLEREWYSEDSVHRLGGIQCKTSAALYYMQNSWFHRLDGPSSVYRQDSKDSEDPYEWEVGNKSFWIRRKHAIEALKYVRNFNEFDFFERGFDEEEI